MSTPYAVKNYAGTVVIPSIADKTGVDTSTSLSFFGRQYPDYGKELNTNILHLMEHFASSSAPTKPVVGQLFYNSEKKNMMICTSAGATPVWATLAQA